MTTTPNTVALQALLDRVEAGEASWNRLASIAEDALPPKDAALAATANRGSLDAALALHNAVLPGWDMQINTYEDDSFEASVSQPLQVKTYDGVSPFMARAWLLAILRALKSQVNHD